MSFVESDAVGSPALDITVDILQNIHRTPARLNAAIWRKERVSYFA